ncbi:MAG: AarF/ABC1/UbiB kinase family protein [Pseudomonadota bacterium]
MGKPIPETKWRRGMVGGRTAARLGGSFITYLVKQPFLSESGRRSAREDLDRQSAKVLFKTMSLLRGTALKVAQQLSLETDIFPDSVRKELEKSYHQVPPINRALVRKVIRKELGDSPENLFSSFDDTAFAAASLGQVHRAISRDGEALAVKVQYPGIGSTIESDIGLVRSMLRPLGEYDLLKPALDEIQARLLEEIDYLREAENIRFFQTGIHMTGIRIPRVHEETCNPAVISTDLFQGIPLDLWLEQDPSQEERDRVAQTLQDFFIQCLYGLSCIHADPNPGNFIIGDDLTVGVVDFGCVKHLDREFTEKYARLPGVVLKGDKRGWFDLLDDFHLVSPDADPADREEVFEAFVALRPILCRLYEEDAFDFSQNTDVFTGLKPIRERIYKVRHHMDMNPDFVFLDRTRYGLLRIFEKMRARVIFRNDREWPV